MAFLVSTDDDGIHSIGTSSSVVERWTGHSINGTDDFDWRAVPRGRVILTAGVYRPRHLPQVYHQRPNGLFEMAFVRVKESREGGLYLQQPVFASTLDPKKQTTRVLGAFVFADDLAAVHALEQYRARDAANRDLANWFHTYSEAARKERDRAARQQRDREREQQLRQRAEAAGVPYDDVVEGMRIWNGIRSRRYSPRRCFWCGRLLTDPASVVAGIGPECIRQFPALRAAARAKVLDLGRMRFDADRLLARFEQAGMADIVQVIREAKQHEELVSP